MGKDYFEFHERDIHQFQRFSTLWRSTYYMMVDETVIPPADCFLTVGEIEALLGYPPNPPLSRTHIPGSKLGSEKVLPRPRPLLRWFLLPARLHN